jgi:hypothetical protein
MDEASKKSARTPEWTDSESKEIMSLEFDKLEKKRRVVDDSQAEEPAGLMWHLHGGQFAEDPLT